MKIRKGYVSNSSSSSFIVNEDLTDKGLSCMELSLEQKNLINGSVVFDEKINFDVNKKLYLTQYISDCDKKYDLIDEVEHIFYDEGQLNEEPRCEQYYNEYTGFGWEPVYLRREHDVAKQMTFNKFVNEYKKSYLPKEFIVKYESEGIRLIYIR